MNTRTPARPPPSVSCCTFVNAGGSVGVADAAHDRGGEVDDPIEILVVDLVSGVGRPVIVDVRAGEEVEGRHAGLVEARHVGRLVRVGLHDQLEAGGDVGLLDEPPPHVARAGGLHGQLVVLHPADHVEVEVRGDLIERHRRRVHVRRRPDQSDLFARPELEQHVPAPRAGRRVSPTASTAALPDALSSAPK